MFTPEALKKELAKPKHIVVTTHHKPDGDALGSSLAVYHWLKAKGHAVHVIVPSDFAAFLDWMPGRQDVKIYLDDKAAHDALIAEADFIYCLDFNGLARIHAMEEAVRQAPGAKIMIDHHLEPENFDDYRHWDSQAAASAQLVYDFIANVMDEHQSITPDIATCLYTGIMTDTGSFRFQTTTPATHLIAADLITLGAQNWKIHEAVYNSYTENRLKFLGFCLLNRLEVLHEYRTALFSISREDLNRFQITTGDTEGLVNYALAISGMKLAALIIDRTEQVKLSLRSVGDFPCNEVCKTHFNGGGHRNAAGGNSNEPLTNVVLKFKSILPEYKALLIP
ncbi:DHH family phosphoesterase [Parapedobacter sp. ISTM3]|uniref:Phosphoesterase RecJ domain-containing protein n=1 Tax=Parapedobacter luteus TaxID=623280 RepID=A0A1T5CBR3_9SPHI|nr:MULTISPECIES: DHH family phosphoesterase [Parapedobacter]MBK1439086.1 DHH family phosphoesterase [Parapedobacter sp. ISTM3]SKB56859.1 phosphoesterase RecJ domain-containing protein [Parapedobacter luteus]